MARPPTPPKAKSPAAKDDGAAADGGQGNRKTRRAALRKKQTYWGQPKNPNPAYPGQSPKVRRVSFNLPAAATAKPILDGIKTHPRLNTSPKGKDKGKVNKGHVKGKGRGKGKQPGKSGGKGRGPGGKI